jgi:predicted ATP-grasp superfamily ATP-dependent carboligase
VPWCSHRSLELVLDKLELARLATRAGLRAPWTAEATPEALRTIDGRPLVVKPRVPVVEGRHRLFETVLASGRAEAELRVRRLRSEGFVPLLQEHVRGQLIALILVIGRRGEVLARVQQRALRLHPPHAGVSARAETVPVDEQLAGRAHRLLRDVGWFGLAELQLLQPDDGEPCLVDLNGRFYGSLGLALSAGSNLPALWTAAAIGDPVNAIGDPPSGVRYQWLGGELANFRSEPILRRLRKLADAARYGLGATHGVWALSDPGPSAQALASRARRWAMHGRRRSRES